MYRKGRKVKPVNQPPIKFTESVKVARARGLSELVGLVVKDLAKSKPKEQGERSSVPDTP
jgi:hypothetical protein